MNKETLKLLFIQVSESAAITFIIIIINSLFCIVLDSTAINILITSVIIAPLAEEYGKRISIINKYPWLYTFIFSMCEFVSYVHMYSECQGIVFVRSIVVMFHFTTTFIQKELYSSGKPTKGYWISVVVHATHNLVAALK